MINLRTRLLFGYGYLVVLLLLTAGTAGFGFFTISEAIDRILSENFRSVSASVDMMEALEQQNALTMRGLLTEQVDMEAMQEAEETFESALEIARKNATAEGEPELVEELAEQFGEYVAVRDDVLSADIEDMPLELFAFRIFPAFVEARQSVFALTRLNYDAIVIADEEAQATALHMAGLLGLLVTIAVISMVFLSRALQHKVLHRLRALTEVAESHLIGDHHRRFDTTINDELGVVSRQLNAALDARDELEVQMRGRLNQQKQLVLGLLQEINGDLLLLGLDGKLVASTCETLRSESLAAVQTWLVEHRKEMIRDFRETRAEVELSTDLGGRKLHIRLLAAEGRRPVGWMVQVMKET